MVALLRLLQPFSARETPLHDESDEVYPVHMLDDTKTLRTIVVTWTLRFNDVLDANKLHTSLSKLLEIGDWKKLGGRLRMKQNGRLEIHVPRPFTTERPSVLFSHETLAMSIEDHPHAKTLPKATENPSIQLGPQGFRAFAAQKNAPATLEDFLYSDTPQMSLHITSFDDATLVGLSWPHTLMDVMGQQALLRGWSLVLAGRDSEVPPMLGAREDVLCAAVDAHVENMEEFRLRDKQLSGLRMARFGLRFTWDMLWNPVMETRTMFLPAEMVAELRSQVQSELAAQNGGKENSFVSEGDVLTAWAVRAVASSLPQPRPVTVLHALNVRFRVSALIRASGVFTQNMAVAAFTFLSPEVATGSLGHIAFENRRHLGEQATETQVLAQIHKLQKESKSGNDPMVLCGEPDALLMPFTNWTRAGFFQVADFSKALVRPGDTKESRTNPPGTIVYHHAQSMQENTSSRNVVVVLGKDHGDNYWLTGTFPPCAWAKIQESMNNFSLRH